MHLLDRIRHNQAEASSITTGTHCQLCHGFTAVRERRHAKLQAAMEDVMTAIVRQVNDKKDHIPPVTSPAVLTFPFEITIAG